MKLTIDDIRGIHTNSDPENVNKTYAEKLENILPKRGKVVKKSLPQVEYLFTAGTSIYTEDAIHHNLSFDNETTYILGKNLTNGGRLELYRSGANSWHPVTIDLENPSLGLVGDLIEPSLTATPNGWVHTDAHNNAHTLAQSELNEDNYKGRFIDDSILFDFAFNHAGKSVSSVKFIGTSPVTFEIPIQYTQGTPSNNVVNTNGVGINFKTSVLDGNGLTTNYMVGTGGLGTAYYPIEGYIQIEYSDNVFANTDTISFRLFVLPEIEFKLHPDTIAKYGNQLEKWWDLYGGTSNLTHDASQPNSTEKFMGMTPFVETRTGDMFYWGIDYIKVIINAKNVKGFAKKWYNPDNDNYGDIEFIAPFTGVTGVVDSNGNINNYEYTIQTGRNSSYPFSERAISKIHELNGVYAMFRYLGSGINNWADVKGYRDVSPYGKFYKADFKSNDYWRFQFFSFPYAVYDGTDGVTPEYLNEETLSDNFDFNIIWSRTNKPYLATGVLISDGGVGNNIFQVNGQSFYQFKWIDEDNDIRVYIIFPKNAFDSGNLHRCGITYNPSSITEANQGIFHSPYQSYQAGNYDGIYHTLLLEEGYKALSRPAIYNDFTTNTLKHTLPTQRKRFSLGDWYARSQDESEFINWWNNNCYLAEAPTQPFAVACANPPSLPTTPFPHGSQYLYWKLWIYGTPNVNVFLMGTPYTELNIYLGQTQNTCTWQGFTINWEDVDSVNTWTIKLSPTTSAQNGYQEVFVGVNFSEQMLTSSELSWGAQIIYELPLSSNNKGTSNVGVNGYQQLLASDDNNGGSFEGDAGNSTAIDLTQNQPPNTNTN